MVGNPENGASIMQRGWDRGVNAWHDIHHKKFIAAAAVVGDLALNLVLGAGIYADTDTTITQHQALITRFVNLYQQEYAGVYINTASTTGVQLKIGMDSHWKIPEFHVPIPTVQAHQTVAEELDVMIGQKGLDPTIDYTDAELEKRQASSVKIVYNPNNGRTDVYVPEAALTYDIKSNPESPNTKFGPVENGLGLLPTDIIEQIAGDLHINAIANLRNDEAASFTKINQYSNRDEAFKCMPTAWRLFGYDRFLEANKAQILEELTRYNIEADPSEVFVHLPKNIAVPPNIYSAGIEKINSEDDVHVTGTNAPCQVTDAARAQAKTLTQPTNSLPGGR